MQLGCTVQELLERVSSHELTEWMAFYELEPFGSQAGYLGHAITSSVIANVNRPKGHKAHEVDDFMPKFEKQTQTPDSMIQLAEMFTIGLGGQDLRQDKSDG